MNSLRVLLVDGGSKKSGEISTTLASANHTVLPAVGLEEAGEALFVEQFDAVLLASTFPPRTLADFTAKLRRVEQSQSSETRIPVLALQSVEAGGTDGSVEEPIDPIALTEAVRSLAHALAQPMQRAVASAAEKLPVLEPDKFEEQVGYDNELMVEIIDLFLAESQKDVSDMNASVAGRDWDSLSKIAHTIKGSLASLHAARARATAQELESAAKSQEVDVSVRAFQQLVMDLRILEPRLLELRDSVAPARA
jgi:HPt (histidine-containing phosphotransfer) domain-containing protein/CheY-like chemotaxis protein